MKAMKSLHLTCLIVVAICCLLNPAWGASLSFNPVNATVDVGDTFEVEIWINDLAPELAVFDFNVLYNVEILSFVDYSLGLGLGVDVDPAWGEETDSWDTSFGDDGAGTLNLGVLSLLEDFSYQADSLLLATVAFYALSAGSSTLVLDSVLLGDADAWEIVATLTEGAVTVNAAQTAPVPEPATGLLFGMGVAGLAALQRRRAQQQG